MLVRYLYIFTPKSFNHVEKSCLKKRLYKKQQYVIEQIKTAVDEGSVLTKESAETMKWAIIQRGGTCDAETMKWARSEGGAAQVMHLHRELTWIEGMSKNMYLHVYMCIAGGHCSALTSWALLSLITS